MKQTQIIYCDVNLDTKIVSSTISECLGLRTVPVSNLFRNQLSILSDLTQEIKKYLDNGDMIPDFLVNQMIENEINKDTDKSILLIGYPRTVQQFESLAPMLLQNAVPISRVWYFKHRDFDGFIEKLYINKKEWTDKYGDEMKSQWIKNQVKIKGEIKLLKCADGPHQWTDIDLTYDNFRDKSYIKNEVLKNCAQQG